MDKGNLGYAYRLYEEVNKLKLDLIGINTFLVKFKNHECTASVNSMTVIRINEGESNRETYLGDITMNNEKMKEHFLEFITKCRDDIENQINEIDKIIETL